MCTIHAHGDIKSAKSRGQRPIFENPPHVAQCFPITEPRGGRWGHLCGDYCSPCVFWVKKNQSRGHSKLKIFFCHRRISALAMFVPNIVKAIQSGRAGARKCILELAEGGGGGNFGSGNVQ